MKSPMKTLSVMAAGLAFAAIPLMATSAQASLLCPPATGEFVLCYIVNKCTENGDGSASGDGYSLDPGRCVGKKPPNVQVTHSVSKFKRSMLNKNLKFFKTPHGKIGKEVNPMKKAIPGKIQTR